MSAGAVEGSAAAECTVAVAARTTSGTECATITGTAKEVRCLAG